MKKLLLSLLLASSLSATVTTVKTYQDQCGNLTYIFVLDDPHNHDEYKMVCIPKIDTCSIYEPDGTHILNTTYSIVKKEQLMKAKNFIRLMSDYYGI